MESVPAAVATGSQLEQEAGLPRCYPVATAPGTDLILKLRLPIPLFAIMTAMNLFDEFEWRGMLYEATPELREVLAKEKLTAYIGFDPSAASLHVGSLLPVMGLARLQRFGHTPIAIAGGGTGLIGDPNGKTKERQLLTHEQVEENLVG